MPLVRHLGSLFLLCCLLHVSPAFAVASGELDTFGGGTTENWTVSLLGMGVHPAPPANVPDGGPSGAGDNFMRLTSFGGAGAGARLSVINTTQWTGNFIGAGITSIRMDVNNLGTTDLVLRLLFADPTAAAPPSNIALSTAGAFVPGGSGWMSIIFPIALADLTAELGSVAAALTNATEMRIFHNPDPDFPGPPLGIPAITALLGVDNIQAVSSGAAISAPHTGALLLLGLALMAGLRRLPNRRS
jgi:hypothetical protein